MTTYTREEVFQILRNLGHDVECGACMSVAFTGVNIHAHTCEDGRAMPDVVIETSLPGESEAEFMARCGLPADPTEAP